MCINSPCSVPTMGTMFPSMVALYQHIRETRQVKTPAAISRLMGVSQQRLKNWEERGISKEGAMLAQDLLKIDGNALLKLDKQSTLPASWRAPSEPAPNVQELMPTLKSIEWPFATITAADWRSLSESDRTEIENIARRYLRSREVTQSHPSKHPNPDGHPLSMAEKKEKAA